MTPDELLQRHTAETLPWLRRQLRLSRRAFAAWLGVPATVVARWEDGTSGIPRGYLSRLAPLVARYLATAEGAAFVASVEEGHDDAR